MEAVYEIDTLPPSRIKSTFWMEYKALTIHLYRKDEVLSAFRWSIVTRNIIEACYWGLELFDSDMEDDAIRLLLYVWMTEIGYGSWAAFMSIRAIDMIDRIDWIRLIHGLCRITIHDSSALQMIGRGPLAPLDPLNDIKTRASDISLIEGFSMLRLTDTIGYLDRLQAFNMIQQIDRNDTLKHALSEVLVNLSQDQWIAAQAPLDLQESPDIMKEIDAWDEIPSLRKRRIYTIRYEALLHLTFRSQQESCKTSESDLINDMELYMFHSSYWKNVLARYNVTELDMNNQILWHSDNDKIAFYNTYFSIERGDIPDEWSAADRMISHGYGLGKDPEKAHSQFLELIYRRSTVL